MREPRLETAEDKSFFYQRFPWANTCSVLFKCAIIFQVYKYETGFWFKMPTKRAAVCLRYGASYVLRLTKPTTISNAETRHFCFWGIFTLTLKMTGYVPSSEAQRRNLQFCFSHTRPPRRGTTCCWKLTTTMLWAANNISSGSRNSEPDRMRYRVGVPKKCNIENRGSAVNRVQKPRFLPQILESRFRTENVKLRDWTTA